MRCALALNDGAQQSFYLLPTAIDMNVRPYLNLGLACFLSALTGTASADGYGMTISQEENLHFGSMVVISTGEVTIKNNLIPSPHVMVPSSVQVDNPTPARFVLTCSKKGFGVGMGLGSGKKGKKDKLEYRLELIEKPKEVVIARGGLTNMDLRDFQVYSASGEILTKKKREIRVRDCPQFSEVIYVGATLNVVRSQPPGHYTGDSNITLRVSYDYED